jgi:hypothetical protein
VVGYTQRRFGILLVLPGLAVVGTTVIFLVACFPAAIWHEVQRLVGHLPAAKNHASKPGLHLHLPLRLLQAVLALTAGLGWLVAVGFFCVQFAEWRYSVYVLTNARIVRRFVSFDWHARRGLASRRFQVFRKPIPLRDIRAVTSGLFGAIHIEGQDGSLLMTINYIPRPAEFVGLIESTRATQFHSS